MAPFGYMRQRTAFGEFTVVWDGSGRIRKIYLPDKSGMLPSDYPGAELKVNPGVGAVADDVSRFLAGLDVRFSLDAVALDTCTEFQRRVLLAEYGIPRGYVSTYDRIAGHVGCPGGARAVGGALASNPFPIVIPCHRAVRSDGSLGGYQGGTEMKRRLLQMEGIGFNGGKVDMKRVYY
jgi:methylated-DNA-[protein]-cysteine S-methyltransferase